MDGWGERGWGVGESEEKKEIFCLSPLSDPSSSNRAVVLSGCEDSPECIFYFLSSYMKTDTTFFLSCTHLCTYLILLLTLSPTFPSFTPRALPLIHFPCLPPPPPKTHFPPHFSSSDLKLGLGEMRKRRYTYVLRERRRGGENADL